MEIASNSSDIPIQTIKQSFLELLIQPLFSEVCSFLELEEKCALLSVLNKFINNQLKQTMKQSMRNAIVIDLSDGNYDNEKAGTYVALAVKRCQSVLPYVQYASHLSFRLPRCYVDPILYQSIKAKTKASLFSGSLIGLSIYAELHEWIDLFTPFDTDLSTSPSFNLQMLSLNVSDDEPSVATTDRSKWSSALCAGLKNCHQLSKLFIRFPTSSHNHLSFVDVLRALPCSIEELTLYDIQELDQSTNQFQLFEDMCRSSSFLPHLRVLDIPVVNERGNISEIIATTVMSSTNTIRPIAQWQAVESEQLSSVSHFSLVYLELYHVSQSVFKFLSESSCDLFPNLKRLKASLYMGKPSDVQPVDAVMHFASLHELSDLELYVTTEELFIFSNKALQSLCDITSLQCLRVRSFGMQDSAISESHDLSNVFCPGCWSHLKILELCLGYLAEEELGPILRAAPHLRCVEISMETDGLIDPCDSATILAMVLSMCSFIEQIHANGSFDVPFDDCFDAFQRYPVDDTKMQHLMYVSAYNHVGEAVAYLCEVLRAAPQLRGIDLNVDSETTDLIGVLTMVSCLRTLPHLISINNLSKVLTKVDIWCEKNGESVRFNKLSNRCQPKLPRWVRSLCVQNMCMPSEHSQYLSLVDYEQFVPFLKEGHLPMEFNLVSFATCKNEFFGMLDELIAIMRIAA